MFNNISYKNNIDDIKKEIQKQYMQVAYNYTLSGEYCKKRTIRISKIIIYNTIYLLINIFLYTRTFPLVDEISANCGVFAFIMTLLAPLFIGLVIYFQNFWFHRDIKKQCMDSIIINLANIEYVKNYNDSFKKTCILTSDDIRKLNLTETFNSRVIDDTFVGNYKNTIFCFQELELYNIDMGRHRTLEYKGVILKANINTNVDGWIEVQTKESIDKSSTFIFYLVLNFVLGIFLIVAFNQLLSLIPCCQYAYIGLIILNFIICYFIAKHKHNVEMVKLNLAKKQTKYSNIKYINENFCIKTSNNRSRVDNVINTEFIEIIDSLKKLFVTNKVWCKFYSNNIMLAISTAENMFEIGGLFTPPTNRKIMEKFTSQITGILIFLDFITSQNKKET